MSSNLCTYIAWVRTKCSIKRSQVTERASRNESVKFTYDNLFCYAAMVSYIENSLEK